MERTTQSTGSPTKVSGDPESGGWSKGVTVNAGQSDERLEEKNRSRPAEDNSFIKRSDKKREPPKQEEQKELDSAGLRRNRPPKQSEDDNTGFARGNFKSKKEDEAPKKDGPRDPAKKSKYPKFFFKGCWECGKEGHSRHECDVWKKLLAANQGKPPKGHKGAKDRAYLKWKEEKKATKKHKVNALGVQDPNETEDDDWESSDDEGE